MNLRDINNLEFLKGLQTDDEWEDWANSVTQHDLDYALNLVTTANNELTHRAILLDDPEIDNLDMAESILSKYCGKVRGH